MTVKRRRSWGTIKKLPSGNHRASYVGPDGITYAAPQTYKAKIDAEGWLGNVRRTIDLETWTPPGAEKSRGLSLAAYSAIWLSHRTLKPRTRSLYDDLLRLHINPKLGDLKVSAVSPAAVRVWYAELATGPTRKAHAYSLLHAIMATAVSDEVIDANPCRIRSAMQTKRKRDIGLLTPQELSRLAEEMPERLFVAVLLLGWCGLRSGELKELRRKDVGKDAATLRVERAVTYRSGVTTVDTPKTAAGVRTVAVPPHIRSAITAHLDRIPKHPDALLFAADDGGHITDWEFRKPFKKAAAAIGKPDLRVHDLRHVGAVLAAQAGATTAELMLRIGHTTPAMAMRYQSVAAGRDAELAEKLSKMMVEDNSKE
ncbi:tyrosine-type recombinase/integrase [Rhodococcus qingshengii]|uniref:tyrosine-type recombinase/integrase n=1 Tax=Rhodococcus qingshengii TaxID=334542 RepID=UPI002AFF1C5C|nr:tyrosine-type recombinase/integrase [Rhodococcus qingshengii]MEA1797703.1 tyrosine-type recombinase/integrase [Rhodococcus qingshengii]